MRAIGATTFCDFFVSAGGVRGGNGDSANRERAVLEQLRNAEDSRGVPVPGARVERRKHQHAARKTMVSERECVSCAEPWEQTADTLHRASDDPRALPLCDWPIPQPVDWLGRVNEALTGAEIDALRKCTERGRPYGSGPWT